MIKKEFREIQMIFTMKTISYLSIFTSFAIGSAIGYFYTPLDYYTVEEIKWYAI
jgi:cytochrome c-type biogenesis protein CcmE